MTAVEEPGRALVDWWRRRSVGGRIVTVVVGALLAANLGLAVFDGAWGNSPGGPASSASGTGDDGLAAYADLLADNGHQVSRFGRTLRPGDLATGETAVVARVETLERADVEALAGLLASGGRVVVAGEGGAELIEVLAGVRPQWERGEPVDDLAVWLPGPDTGAARELSGDEGGRWRGSGPWALLAGAPGPVEDGGGAILLALDVGRGRIVALADVGPLRNDRLGWADDAALGLAIVGGPEGAVAFVEGGGPTGATGLAAVPWAWRWAAAGGAFALLVGLWAAGARFGPPEPDRRELRPARAEHVEAVAAEMERAAAAAGRSHRDRLDTVLAEPHQPGDPE